MTFSSSKLNKISDFVPSGIMLVLLLITVNYAAAQHHASGPLSAPGNDIFGALQETIMALEQNPRTNWEQVDLESLRQHLLDMKAFTEDVTVLEKTSIDQGVRLQVRPVTERAQKALKRVLAMHPKMLKKEKGWTMESEQGNGIWTIRCTSANSDDVPKIRALGYIGLMATGAHHQHHHWMIATGKIQYPPK